MTTEIEMRWVDRSIPANISWSRYSSPSFAIYRRERNVSGRNNSIYASHHHFSNIFLKRRRNAVGPVVDKNWLRNPWESSSFGTQQGKERFHRRVKTTKWFNAKWEKSSTTKQIWRIFLYLFGMSIVTCYRRMFMRTLFNLRFCTWNYDLDIKEVINIWRNSAEFWDVLAELEIRVVQDEIGPTVTTTWIN